MHWVRVVPVTTYNKSISYNRSKVNQFCWKCYQSCWHVTSQTFSNDDNNNKNNNNDDDDNDDNDNDDDDDNYNNDNDGDEDDNNDDDDDNDDDNNYLFKLPLKRLNLSLKKNVVDHLDVRHLI